MFHRFLLVAGMLLVTATISSGTAGADSGSIDFESYSLGTVHGQDGWSSSGAAGSGCAAYDHAIASGAGVTGFGAQSLRISNAVTSGCFEDQTFSKSLADEAGETAATNGGLSGGTRQPYFEAQWDIASTVPLAQQAGLFLSVSPDRGDGARMSYLGITDAAAGLDLIFYDVQQSGPCVPSGCANFVGTTVASGLARGLPHTLKLTMEFVDGPGNDVVKVYVDGSLVHTGTSWEDYFRYDPEAAADQNTHPVDSLLFRTGGTAAPATAGNGFLIDNIQLLSGPGPVCTFTTAGTTMTLDADCVTDQTILIPDGFTLDGDSHTVTAVDPAGGHFLGAVVMNAGTVAHVTNLTVTASGLANVCDGGDDRLRGIMLDGASGSITNSIVTNVNQGPSGCQEGNAIEVRNGPFNNDGPDVDVIIDGNAVSGYIKNGITANGSVAAAITNNVVKGAGPVGVPLAAQNGIQVGFGATAVVHDNVVSGHDYTPDSWLACGLLFYEADGVKQAKNSLFANEKDLCNFGRGGGHFNPEP